MNIYYSNYDDITEPPINGHNWIDNINEPSNLHKDFKICTKCNMHIYFSFLMLNWFDYSGNIIINCDEYLMENALK